jgi:hypothetical protein
VIAQGDQQVSSVVDGVAVMMDVGNGRYYRLDDVGTRVWSLLEQPTTLGALCAQLVQEFNVDRVQCEADVAELLGGLLQQNLIRVVSRA